MASRGLGSLTLDLIAKIGGFTGPLSKAERELDSRARAMAKKMDAVGKTIGRGLAIGVTIASTAIIAAMKSALDAADNLQALSLKTGITVEKLSTLGYAAKQSGTDMDGLSTGLKFLAKNMAAAVDESSKMGKLFEALDIDVVDKATGKLREATDILPELADRFKAMDNAALETSLAVGVLGKSGADLIEFLNQGSVGISELEQRARDLGIEISSGTAAAADEFKDKLEDVKAVAGALATKLLAELLPELIKLADRFTAFVSDGNRVRETAERIATGFEVIGSVAASSANLVSGITQALGGLVQQAAGYFQVVASLLLLNTQVRDAGFANIKAGAKLSGGGIDQLVNVKPKKPAQYNGPLLTPSASLQSALEGQKAAEIKAARESEARIMKLLGDPTGRAGKGKKGGAKAKTGKTDAQREAEQLEASYVRMLAQIKEQIAFTGELTEVEKLRYELANGDMAKLDEGKKTELLNLTAQLEAGKKQQELVEEGKRLTESLLTPTEEINKLQAEAKVLLDAKAISQETYNRALEDYKEPGELLLEDLREEIKLLGMSNEQQEIYNNLKYGGVDAQSALGKAIVETTEQLQQQRQQYEATVEFMDTFRNEAADLFTSLVDGSKSAKEAFTDFFDNLAAMITRMIAERWIQQLFGSQGSTGAGTQGGGWISALFGAFFGGGAAPSGMASGGPVSAGNLYRVNENGPEMLSVGGRDYLMMGNRAGKVTPNGLAIAGGSTINNTFLMPAMVTRQTQEQVAQRMAVAGNRASSRNR